MSYAVRTKPRVEGYVRGQQTSGFRFGPGNWADAPGKPEVNVNRIEPGVSFAPNGFEVLTHDGVLVGWYECPLDACDALKLCDAPGKIVRCSDRALIKIRHPRKGRP